MDSTAIVERFIREAWLGGDAAALEAMTAPGDIREVFARFHSAFAEVALNELGPVFADPEGVRVAFYAELHLRQVGRFLHVDATGAAADVGATGIFEVTDGRITRMWVEIDFATLIAELPAGRR